MNFENSQNENRAPAGMTSDHLLLNGLRRHQVIARWE
jgi:hypothetical protein